MTKHLLHELGNKAILMNYVNSQLCKSMGIQARIRKNEARDAEIHVLVNKKLINLAQINTKLNKADLMTKSHTSEAQKKRLCDDGVETR